MSYAQLAEIRGITKKAAQRLTLRHRWRRQPANDGGVLVWVPEDAATPGRQRGGQTVRHDGGADTLMASALAALEDAVAALRDQLDVANARAERTDVDRADGRQQADDLRAQIEVLNAEIVVMRGEADRALAEERHRADRAEAAIVAAESDVRELRSHAAALQVELADRQAALDRTQTEAEAARERAADLQAGQELMMDMHARALAEAQEQFSRVRDAAEGMREREQERRARGLLARLRAAVRGSRDGGGG